ncbi:hypothetical protein diail_410 [Diaporthe ilicicola]|nr:hypothetical protein diail_410 [Diaporthe ilicicola]
MLESTLHPEYIHIIRFTLCVLLIVFALSTLDTWRRLRHIPGPTLSWLGSSWLIRNAVTGATGPNSRDLARYGSLVRIGPNAVATDDPNIVLRLSRTPYVRDAWYHGFRLDGARDNLFTILDQTLHDKAKAKTARAMAGKDGVDLESGIDAQIGRLLAIIRSKHLDTPDQHRVVDLAPLIRFFASDAFTSLFYGKELGFMDVDDLYDVAKLNDQVIGLLSLLADLSWLRAVMHSRFLSFLQPRSTDKIGIGRLQGIAKGIVEERHRKGMVDQQDILGSFMRNGLEPEECYNTGILFLLAGGDTIAATLRGILMFTMATPHVYQKLKQTIRQAVAEDDLSSPITADEAQKLPYLAAVIHEGLRLRPAGTLGHPKVVPPQGDTIEGYHVPRKTAVYVNWVSMGLRKDVFGDDSEIFRPERYFECSEKKKAEMQRTSEMAFGVGRYRCSGKVIALAEIYKVVFELFRHLDFQVVNPGRPWEERSWVSWAHTKMMVRITEDKNLQNWLDV